MKICPILTLAYPKAEIRTECLGEQCALFVKIVKPAGPRDFDIAYRRYHGCGLVSEGCIPWEPVPMEQRKNQA